MKPSSSPAFTSGTAAIIGAGQWSLGMWSPIPSWAACGKAIRKRYDEETIQRLLALRWWDFPPEQMRKCLDALEQGDLQALEQMAGV